MRDHNSLDLEVNPPHQNRAEQMKNRTEQNRPHLITRLDLIDEIPQHHHVLVAGEAPRIHLPRGLLHRDLMKQNVSKISRVSVWLAEGKV